MNSARWFGSIAVVMIAATGSMFARPTVANAYDSINHKSAIDKAFDSGDACGSTGQCPSGATRDELKRAIMLPDTNSFEDLPSHCDGGDYLTPADNGGKPYPVSRAEADQFFYACIGIIVGRFADAVRAADKLVRPKADGSYEADQAQRPNYARGERCTFTDKPSGTVNDGRAACLVFENIGVQWHAITDFYSHSNFSDVPNPLFGVSVNNPPGLNNGTATAPFLRALPLWEAAHGGELYDNLINEATLPLPAKLSTGCYNYAEGLASGSAVTKFGAEWSGSAGSKCVNRISENWAMQKDLIISPRALFPPSNFHNAHNAASNDVRRQWVDFRQAIDRTYGPAKGTAILAALTDSSSGASGSGSASSGSSTGPTDSTTASLTACAEAELPHPF